MKICHMTTAHGRYDVRIFQKECSYLASIGYDVTLIVADGKGEEQRSGVRILDAGGGWGGRLKRVLRAPKAVLALARTSGAEAFHFHDPELLPVARRLARSGFPVIYDSHEDLPRQLLSKPYLSALSRCLLALVIEAYENWAVGAFFAVVSVTDPICDRFKHLAHRVYRVANFPSLRELYLSDEDVVEREPIACYVGGITMIRGVEELAAASFLTDTPILLAGTPEDEEVWRVALRRGSRLKMLGQIDRLEVGKLLRRASVGIVTFTEVPNHVTALPTKMFEYMAAGVPVVASNFPLWREIVEGGRCGICVDPKDPQAIAKAVDRIVGDPKLRDELGANGRRLVLERYNWESESVTLAALYKEIASALG